MFYRFLIYSLNYLFIQLFNLINFMLLQGNLPLEFKECGTFLGRGFRGKFKIWRIGFFGKIYMEDGSKEER